MSTIRTSITFDDELYKTLKYGAADQRTTLSDYVSSLIKDRLAEDLNDLQEARKARKDPTITLEQLIKNLKLDDKV